jgi:hypothetical protein
MDLPHKPNAADDTRAQRAQAHRGGWIVVSLYLVGVAVWYLIWQQIH